MNTKPPMSEQRLRNILRDVWVRDISADDGFNEIWGEPFEGHTQIAGGDPSLIAAAPELLEALQRAVEYLKANRPKGKIKDIFSQLNEHENGVLRPALDAIAKATGC